MKDKREVEKSLTEIRDLKHNLNTFETTKTEIITEVNKLKSNNKTLKRSVSNLRKSLRINQWNDSRVQGVVSLKS